MCSAVIMLTMSYDLEGQSHDFEDGVQGHLYWIGFLPLSQCISGVNLVNVLELSWNYRANKELCP